MEMCFHSNQHPWAIKHPFISLYFKYQSLKFICLPVKNSPVFPSLDNIYCTSTSFPVAIPIPSLLLFQFILSIPHLTLPNNTSPY